MTDESQADELSKARAWQRRKMLELAIWQQQWTWTPKLSPQQFEAATVETKRGLEWSRYMAGDSWSLPSDYGHD